MKIAWEETGSGAPLLLIQGLGYARWSWAHLAFFFAAGIGSFLLFR